MRSSDERFPVELTSGELELVEVGLNMLLKAEDDTSTIELIKDLLPRLRAAGSHRAVEPEDPVPAA